MESMDQGQGFSIQDLLQGLVSLISPSEADAATRRPSAPVANQVPQQATPVTNLPPVPGMTQPPDYQGLNVQQALQLRQQLVSQQQNQQRMQMQQQKAAPQDVGQRLAQILGEGPTQGGPTQDVLFRGMAPGTNTPYFSNYKAPKGYADEATRAQFQEDYNARQAEIAAAKAAKGSGSDAETLNKVAQLMTTLEKAGVPADVRSLILQKTFPQYKPEKELTPEQTGKLWKFNPLTRDFDPVPPELTGLPGKQLQAMGYRTYSDKARGAVDELKDVNVAFQQLKSAVGDIQNKSAIELKGSEITGGNYGFGPEGAVFKKASTNFTTIFDKFLGGVRGAGSPQMQAIRAQVLPSIISSGEVSDKLMSDLGDLIQTMGDSRLKSTVGGTAFDSIAVEKQAAKVLRTWAQTQGQGQGSAPAKAAPTQRGQQQLPNGVKFQWKD